MTRRESEINPFARMPAPIRRFVDVGHVPGDDPETTFHKRMLLATAGLVFTVVSLLLAVTWTIRTPRAVFIPGLYLIATALGFVVFVRTRRLEPFRSSQLTMYLLFPTVLQWSLGGYVNSSASIMYAITASILAVVLVGPSTARWWLIAFVALAVLSGVLDSYFRERAPELEMSQIVISFTMTAVAIAIFAVVPLAFFVDARRRLTEELAVERKRSDDLLRVVLPGSIAERLKQGERSIADKHEHVAILFADIVGSTVAGAALTPEELIDQLNDVFTEFDRLASERNLEKIKTIGDGYMVVAGAPEAGDDDAERIADMALAMMSAASARDLAGEPVELRIGIDFGPAVAGVVGASKYQYDLYGDTVNTANRMESHGIPGRIQVTGRAMERLRGGFVFEERGLVEIKGKGEIRTWFLVGVEPDRALRPS